MIKLIYSDTFLSEQLAFRGGTCINKIYLCEPSRYSEDLDFVQIKSEKIGPIANRLKIVLSQIFDSKPAWEAKKGSFKLHYSFIPEGSVYKQKVKIEINTREHFVVKGHVKKKISLNSMWHNGEAEVVTFEFEELLATKLRALYQRRKGRDLFDLWISRDLNPNFERVVDVFGAYMKAEGKSISRMQFIENLRNKMQMPVFVNDIKPLIRSGVNYDPSEAEEFVTKNILQLFPE
ncbi:MAG: nucleotidyl transferase AbiEii/AbiGii toxin family protein [Deltaproteobacteria bacterium]|nr:nucleotidyl transferase AbiEii/AbiGii toxin family protein [Deltaproteobacteria bacterium]